VDVVVNEEGDGIVFRRCGDSVIVAEVQLEEGTCRTPSKNGGKGRSTCLPARMLNCPPTCSLTTTTTNTNRIPQYFISFFALSTLCKHQLYLLQRSTVVKCLRAHQCLTSETLLISLQSDDGRPTSSLGSLDRLPGTAHRQYHSSLVTSLTVLDLAHTPSFFVHPSSHRLLNTFGKTRNFSLSFLWLVHGGFEEFRPTFDLTTYV